MAQLDYRRAGRRSRNDRVSERRVGALIIGCGYLGGIVAANAVGVGQRVTATTRTGVRWPNLRKIGVQPILFDIGAKGSDIDVPGSAGGGGHGIDVFFMLTPSAVAGALEPGGGYDRLLAALSCSVVRRAVLVSSTGVYSGSDVVSAESAVTISDERQARLFNIEQRWRDCGDAFRVCRLAGIYGPGRVIGRRQVVAGDPIAGDPNAWLNLIYVNDAAALVMLCATAENAAPVELGCDGCPVTRREYYAHLARMLEVPEPRFDTSAASRSASKRCNPDSTMRRLKWKPQYPDFTAGLSAALGIAS